MTNLKPKPTTEQAKLIQEMYEYIMELMQTDLTIIVKLEITNNILTFGCFSSNGDIMYFNQYFFFSAPITEWRDKFQLVKHQILAIVNEVDISEITDKNQNIGC